MALGQYLRDFTRRDWEEQADGEIRFALIGLGWWTREEAIPAIEASDYCRCGVAVSSSKSKADQVANSASTITSGITYEQFHAGEATDEYDAVYICIPNATHLEYAETAAGLGKPVLCEKPMEATTDRAQQMVNHFEDEDIELMIAYRMQTEPAVRRARELIQDDVIGDPIHVHSHMSDNLLDLIPNPDQWRLDPELSGGTTLNDVGIYSLNTSRFLLNKTPNAVYASTKSVQAEFAGKDEHTAFQLEFPGPVTATCTASHNAHTCSQLKIIGSQGEVTVEPVFFPWDDRKLRVAVDDVMNEITFDQVNQMTEEFDYFANHLLTDRPPSPNGKHGLQDLEVIEAAYDSAERGERVDLFR